MAMELFPASDKGAWEFIKEQIDDCDYYILVIAGCYGSQNDKGMSFTELEYDYAFKAKKNPITFLHKDISVQAKLI